MYKLSSIFLTAIGLMGLAPACSIDAANTETSATTEEAFCASPEGANYAMASLAVATAKELKRWQTHIDFRVAIKCDYSMAGCQETIELTPTGRAQCSDGVCKNTQMVLDWQKKEANGQVRFPGGSTVQSDVFASRLAANLKEQINCSTRPYQGSPGTCPVEQHRLELSNTAVSAQSCLVDYWFNAYKAGTSQPLTYPAQLKNQLKTFGQDNPYLQFDVAGNKVKIDPDPGGVGDPPSSPGSCVRTAYLFSAFNIAGNCCEYPAGTYKTFVAKPLISAHFFKCGM